MKMKKMLFAFLVFAIVGSMLAGCTNKDTGLRINFSAEPPALDSSKATTNAAFTMLNAMNEGLYRLDKDGQPTPGLAKDLPKISEDKLTYTITLRDGLKWSDGSPLTAKDFVYAVERVLDPATKAEYAFIATWIKGGTAVLNAATAEEVAAKKKELGMKAINDTTLEITLEHPVPFFTPMLTFGTFLPLKQDVVEKYGETYGKDADKVVGNGPFILKKWQHDQKLVFVKNENYWDAANVKLDTVTVNIVKESETGLNLFETGKADVTELTGESVKAYEGKPEYTVKKELVNAYVMFQQDKPYFKNDKIRQALALAIDQNALVNTVMKNGSVAATGFVPNGTFDGNNHEFRATAGNTYPGYDPGKAKQLLAEGLKELNMTSLPKFKLTSDDTATAKKTLEFILAQWKQNLGIDVTSEPLPHAVRVEKQISKDFDAVIALWGADYNDAMTFLDMWVTDSEFNHVNWSNAKYDQLISKAKVESDAAIRTGLMVQAEKVLMDDMVVAPLYFRSKVYAVKPHVQDLILPSFSSEFELRWASLSAVK